MESRSHTLLAGALAAVLLITPTLAFATPAQQAARPSTQQAAKASATHATSGVVRSIDATTLIISRGKTSAATETFRLSPAAERTGEVAAGARVEVRYRDEGGRLLATVIRVR